MPTSDLTLLHRWQTQRDALAFRELANRHLAMVYATALRMLRSPHDAEDLAQECFEILATTERAPESHVGAWLHRVATRRALDRLKAGARRVQREQVYTDATAKHAEQHWNDLYDHIDALLLDLPDELRHPLVAHFLEGKKQLEVARELGVSRQAVSKRIAKGVEAIRAGLQARGISTSLATLTAFLTAAHDASAATPLVLQTSAGKIALAGAPPLRVGLGSLMFVSKLGAFASLGAVLILIVFTAGLVAWRPAASVLGAHRAPVEEAQPEAAELTQKANVDEIAQGKSWVTPLLDRNTGAATSGVENAILQGFTPAIAGTVSLPDGKPFAGAQVFVIQVKADGTAAGGPPIADAVFATFMPTDSVVVGQGDGSSVVIADEAGRFEIQDLALSEYTLNAGPAGSRTRVLGNPLTRVRLTADRPRAEVALQYGTEGALSIRGRVTDTRNRPVTDAPVWCSGTTLTRAAVVDKDGNFSVDYLPAGTFSIHAGPSSKHITASVQAKAGDIDVELVLEGYGTLQGKVVDARTGRALKSFEVGYCGGHQEALRIEDFVNVKAFRDPAGKFSRDEVYPGEITVFARAEGYEPNWTWAEVGEHEPASGLVVALEPGESTARVEGTVVDEDGLPVSGAAIHFGGIDCRPGDATQAAAYSRADGTFVIEEAPSAAVEISAFHEAYAPAAASIEAEMVVVVRRFAALLATVLEAGQPMARAKLRISYPPDIRTSLLPNETVGADGTALLQHLIPSLATVRVFHPANSDRSLLRKVSLEAGETTAEIFEFPPMGAVLIGRVTLSDGAVAEGRVYLVIETGGDTEYFETEIEADGTYRFVDLPAGLAAVRATIALSDQACSAGAPGLILEIGQSLEQDLRIAGNGSLEALVSLAEGNARATLRLIAGRHDAESAERLINSLEGRVAEVAVVDLGLERSGRIDHIAPGSYTLVAWKYYPGERGHVHAGVWPVEIAAGSTVALELDCG
ncbi:MAG: sigma-70 family RNA polymerase sigma factor [Candidatus Hydrogenedentes bacterium]|nr:sigma-70 family RNA polymerase sigma factor [Candidatus Hydrogenedentota bacterium]